MNNSLLYDKKTACISVILMVLVSVFILGGNGLRAERRRIEGIFMGQNELGIDNQQEAILILTNAANLLVVADRYLERSPDAERIRSIMDSIAVPLTRVAHYDFTSVAEIQFIVVDRILPNVRALLDTMEGVDVSPASAAHLVEIDGNIRGAVRRIGLNDSYRSEAEAFNRLLRNPYTAVIATVRGISELPVTALIFD